MIPIDMDGETAIVTGAAQGIGRGIASRLGEAGANVVLADIQSDEVATAADELAADGATTEAVTCDVTDPDDVEAMVAATEESFGSVEILVNNAGGAGGQALQDLERDAWEDAIDLNLTGTYNCTQAVMPGMRERGEGRIVNISSMAGRNVSVNGGIHYTAAKWGVIGFTKHAARDLAPDVRVNAVCPGGTLTPMLEEDIDEAWHEEYTSRIPLGRLGHVEDQANGVLFLASELSAYMTGTVLEIDGGGQLAAGRD
ncbi:SDR family NAD(P)-dependent oxidoreductase [Halobellus clavatus]|jgi:3-oxoacyl-[acyl-carrier protein] reductase|uniref:3-oxoacyl-[acyl-carrier protein] reductase n=1 Tax=Halobellus clavatus TaxID=660517 RepID=A0A1H3DBM8_9EURY|nr:SDR family NAD(P)-dependent oxidoreductase [Halobellus clavatus]SDX63863.1 3-oxoacyl-[acyl-carrier protein] reductase [Halobellus clavatus]